MPNPSGWQARFGADLQHQASLLTNSLSGVPSALAAAVLLLAVALLVRKALRQVAPNDPDSQTSPPAAGEPEPSDPDPQEQHEREYA